uniref:C2H2-type domain-containing protein n=1 Tax=Leptobrachium leishanense TaxID=445787 RepID=A0A8C5MEM1_9ANUR
MGTSPDQSECLSAKLCNVKHCVYTRKGHPATHSQGRRIFRFLAPELVSLTVLTMTNKNRYQKTEKILDLTLEVNYLLTGEDYVVVMRSGESRLQSGTSHRTEKPSTEPPPYYAIHEKHNKQKILELTNTIIHLLTGEVLAYLQGYKELYQDIITETLQPHHILDGSLNRPEDDVLHNHVPSPNQGRNDGIMNKPREGTGELISPDKSYTDNNILDVQTSTHLPEESADNVYPSADYIKGYPSTFIKVDQASSREGNLSEYTQIKYIFAHHKAESSSCGEENPRNDMYLPVEQQGTYRDRKEDPASQEDGNLIDGKVYPHTEQTQYQSPHIKEESGSCGGGKLDETELYPPTEHRRTECLSTCINEEPALCGGGDLLDTDLYPPTEHTPIGFPPTDLEEPSSCEMENRPGTDMCIVTGHLQQGYLYPSTDIKEESTSNEEENLSNTDIFPAAEQTQTEYPTTHIKEELFTYDKETLTNLHRKPTEYLYKRIDEEPVSHGNLPCQNVQIQRLSGILSTGIIAPEISTMCSDRPGFKSCPIRPNKISQGGEMSWTCSECGKGFQLESALMLHQKIHTGEKTYGFNEPEKLPGQILDLRGPQGAQRKEKPYSCSACGKCFSHVADLCKHQVVHVRAQSFPCSECRKLFSSKSNLNAHLRFHEGKNRVSYSELGKHLGKPSCLHKHQAVNANGKSYPCSECGKMFTSKSNLNTHQRIHTGVRLFSCSECEKCFTDGANLSHHQLTHTGEKPFACPVCGKRFGRKFSLTRHQRVHAEQKVF